MRRRDGTVIVMHDAKFAPVAALIAALRDAGYESAAADGAA